MPDHEIKRLEEVRRYEVTNALVGRHLHDVVELAQTVFDIENVSISTIYEDHQVCHVAGGEPPERLLRSQTFCQTTIGSNEVLVVEDASADPNFSHLPIVRGGPRLRFYAGAPLVTPKGYRLGALCLTDDKPRSFDDKQARVLKQLAALAMEHMDAIRMIEEAKFDELTGLRNRRFLKEAMDESIAADRASTTFIIDLDKFKEINDSLGHGIGDETLAEVAARLLPFDVDGRVIGRLGGDEFVVFADGHGDPLEASALARDIVAALDAPMVINGHLLQLSASVGVVCRSNEPTALQLLGNADLAMYQAKADGRNGYRLFERSMRATALERGGIVLELKEAWESGELELYYQPIVRLADGAWIGAEALLRWNYPYRGVISPAAFLPVLEKSHLALPVGRWIIEDACRQAAQWRSTREPNFCVAVNLFAAQFQAGDLVQIVRDALEANDLPSSALKLELTERILLANDRRVLEQVKELKELGVGIAFDDFGTGFASLSALKDYPVTCLKIDRSFVAQMVTDAKDLSIIDALMHISRTFDLEVVAEGIETEEQRLMILERLCPSAQGFLFSRPVTVGSFERTWDANVLDPEQHRLQASV